MLSHWLDDYDRRAPFYCHLAWHLALFELQCGRPARAFAIHERDIATSANARLAMIDGSALLWRVGPDDGQVGPPPPPPPAPPPSPGPPPRRSSLQFLAPPPPP